MTREDIIKELSYLNKTQLSNPFPYEDTSRMQKDFKKNFSLLQAEECFNADFNNYCSIIAGTISYISKGNVDSVPRNQIDFINSSFFEQFNQYCFIEASLSNYSNLYNEYTNHERARRLILDFLSKK